ncbi:hypothetical protein ACA910_010302 [Epithemia clementina (nom. ined.)]
MANNKKGKSKQQHKILEQGTQPKAQQPKDSTTTTTTAATTEAEAPPETNTTQDDQVVASPAATTTTTETMTIINSTTTQGPVAGVVAATQPATPSSSSSSSSSIPPELTPLHGAWTLWFDNPKIAPAGSDWSENLKEIATFQTVEHFWQVYNNVIPPSMISLNSNYSVFRQGIQPAWEHPSNLEGGKFLLTLPKPKQQQQQQQQGNNSNTSNNKGKGGGKTEAPHIVPKLDEYWLFTVLAILGETMDATGDQICGAVVSVRKNQDRIALWLKTGNKEICVRIGERWKKALDLEKTNLRYQTHKDAAATGRSFRIEVHFEV